MLLGKKERFAEIVVRYETRVRGYCRGMLHDEHLAEDAAQDVFVKAYQRLSSFEGGARFSTWLFRITRNHCIDIFRARSKQVNESFDELDSASSNGVLLERSNHGQQVEAREMLSKVLLQLTPEHREVLLLRELQGLSYEEISEVTGTSLDSVKGKLKRIRAQIAQYGRHLSSEVNVNTARR